MKYSGIGGQAVIEGIMMKNADTYATAVRKPDGTIAVEKDTYEGFAKKFNLLKIPFVRGIFVFIDSMVVGSKCLRFSASFFEDDEDSKESKFEAFLKKTFGDKIDNIIMTLSMIFSFVLAIGIFMLLPMALSNILKLFISNYYVIAVVEGFIRVAIFIIYILNIIYLQNKYILLILIIIIGYLAGISNPKLDALILQSVPEENQTSIFSIFSTLITLTVPIGTVIILFISNVFSVNVALYVLLILLLILTIYSLKLKEK